MTLPTPPARSGMVKEAGGAAGGGPAALGNGDHRSAREARRAHELAARSRRRTARRMARPARRSRVTPAMRLQLRLFRISDPVVVVSMLLGVFLVTNLGQHAGWGGQSSSSSASR